MRNRALGPVDPNNDVYKVAARPFVLERAGEHDKAIDAYKLAIEVLEMAVQKFKKSSNVPKVGRKMFERQAQLHRDRLAYLQGLQRKGSFADVVPLPTVLDFMEEVNGENGQRTLSYDRKDLFEQSKSNPNTETSHNPSPLPSLTSTLPSASSPSSTRTPLIYRITHSSELVALGTRSHWFFLKDATNTHTLYAFQAIWSDSTPIVTAVLRRPGELLPSMGAVSVHIRRNPATDTFGLETSTVPDIGVVTETPDAGTKRKRWSPRRFSYGGRHFVWRNEGEGGFLKSFTWDTLYETTSPNGEGGEVEVIGERLCWGEKKAWNGAENSIFLVDGLDMGFREHLLASQMARMVRVRYPPNKGSSGGLEAAEAGMGLMGFIQAVSG